MSRISYVKYKAKKGRLSKAYYEAVSDGLNEFIKHMVGMIICPNKKAGIMV